MAYPYQPTYSPNYGQPNPTYMPSMTNSNQGATDIIWVQGLAGAKAYPVAAGRSGLLMDSEDSIFYIKTTDQSGMPQPLRIFRYDEISEGSTQSGIIDTSNLITREEFDEVVGHLQKIIDDLSSKQTKSTNTTSYSRKGNSNGKPIIQ